MTTERIIELAEKRGEFLQLEDGYIYYWPNDFGAFSAHVLRTLADELDRRNGPWEGVVLNEPALGGPLPGANA